MPTCLSRVQALYLMWHVMFKGLNIHRHHKANPSVKMSHQHSFDSTKTIVGLDPNIVTLNFQIQAVQQTAAFVNNSLFASNAHYLTIAYFIFSCVTFEHQWTQFYRRDILSHVFHIYFRQVSKKFTERSEELRN